MFITSVAELQEIQVLDFLLGTDNVVAVFKQHGLLEMSKDFAQFKRNWTLARYSTTEVADQYWFKYLKILCKTAFEARLYGNILLTELKRCGSQEAMIGRVQVEMRAVHTSQFVLPTKMKILPPDVG